MPSSIDFRKYVFSNDRILKTGKYLGRNIYWKVFTIENLLRVIIHSILSIQYYKGIEWWDDLAGSAKEHSEKNQRRYSKDDAKFYSTPGKHPIYYVDLLYLNEIIRANRPLFEPVFNNRMLDKLIVTIEDIRIPRNIVAHMNYPNNTDIERINTFFSDMNIYLELVKKKKFELIIP